MSRSDTTFAKGDERTSRMAVKAAKAAASAIRSGRRRSTCTCVMAVIVAQHSVLYKEKRRPGGDGRELG